MENEKPVVRASRAKFGKTLLGGFQVAYRCPRCKQELITNNNAIAAGDKCPHCQASFVFDDQIKEAFAAVLAEKQAREAEKERVREAKKADQSRSAAEQARWAAEAEEQEARDRKARRHQEEQESRDRKAQEVREELREQGPRDKAMDVSDAHGCLNAILLMGAASASFLLFAALMLFSSATSSNDNASHGVTLLIASVSALMTLGLVYVFGRMLGAIHTVLVRILDRLNNSSSGSN